MISVVGAGAVGLAVGARLARAGHGVLFVSRRAASARAISRGGVHLHDPASGEAWSVADGVEAVNGIGAAGPRIGEGPVLLCVRASDTAAAADELATAAPGAVVVSLQNDVGNCAILAARLSRVVGGVYRQTCTRTADNAAVAIGWGRVVIGAWPDGTSDEAEAIGKDLRAAGYDVGVSERIQADQWLKLAVNLMSAPNALVDPEDHETTAFVQIKVRLLEEARQVFTAAGIEATSCDGRDRTLEEEIAFQRASVSRGTSRRRLPVYNQVWSALRDGGPLEADAYHRRILDLAKRHGIETPQNAHVLAEVVRAFEARRGPERVRAEDLLAR